MGILDSLLVTSVSSSSVAKSLATESPPAVADTGAPAATIFAGAARVACCTPEGEDGRLNNQHKLGFGLNGAGESQQKVAGDDRLEECDSADGADKEGAH